MRFKKSPRLPGAGRTRAWYHHGSHMPTSPGAILRQPKHFGHQCNNTKIEVPDHFYYDIKLRCIVLA